MTAFRVSDGAGHRHVIYWRLLDDGVVGVVTVLHARMHQISRFREDFETLRGRRSGCAAVLGALKATCSAGELRSTLTAPARDG